MSLVSSILSPFPLIDLAFSPPTFGFMATDIWCILLSVICGKCIFQCQIQLNISLSAKSFAVTANHSLLFNCILYFVFCNLYFMFSILADVSWISHSPPSARSFSVTANHSPNNVVAPPLSPINHHNLWTCICLSISYSSTMYLSKNLIKMRNIRASIHLRNKLSVNHSLKNVVTAAFSSRSAWIFRTCAYQHWACVYFCRNRISQIKGW